MKLNQSALLGIVSDAAASTLASMKLHLYQSFDSNTKPEPDDFVEATFSGYSASSVTLSDNAIYDDGSVGVFFNKVFQGGVGGSGGPVANTIQGWYLTDSGSSTVKAWDSLNQPQDMADEFSFLNVRGELRFNPLQDYGQTISG